MSLWQIWSVGVIGLFRIATWEEWKMIGPQWFRNRRFSVEAVQWDGTVACAGAMLDWIMGKNATVTSCAIRPVGCTGADTPYFIIRFHRPVRIIVNPGDWVVRSIDNNFHSCSRKSPTFAVKGVEFLLMPPQVEMCACGHSHFRGGRCWCGCPRFTPDINDEAGEL